MALKLRKSLENTLLAIAGSLILLSAPSPCKAAEELPNLSIKNQAISLNSKDLAHEVYTLDYGTKGKQPIFVRTEIKKGGLKIEFGANDWGEIVEKKENLMNLTPIDPGFSKLVIIHPKKLKISKIEQEAYILPQKEHVTLIPLEKTKFAKKILNGGEKILDNLTPLFLINPIKSIKNKLIEKALTREEKEYWVKAKELEKILGEEYTFDKIESFHVDKIGCIERERKIETHFDTEEFSGYGYLLAMLRPAIGNSSTANRAIGKWVEIYFPIQGKKLPFWIKKQELGREIVNNKEDLKKIIKIRKTTDFGAYDPKTGRTIVYSIDSSELPILNKEKITAKDEIKTKSYFTGILMDIKNEKFSEKAGYLSESKDGKILEGFLEDLYEHGKRD